MKRARYNTFMDVACPTCGSPVTERCISHTGRVANTHEARKRRSSGEPPQWTPQGELEW